MYVLRNTDAIVSLKWITGSPVLTISLCQEVLSKRWGYCLQLIWTKHSVCIILELSSTFILSDDRVSWTPQYSSYKRNQNGKVGGFDLFIFRQSENPKIKSPEKYNVWAPFLKLQHDYFGRFWKARTCKLLWNYHFQDEHWPGADNPLWQQAHQCYQAWWKAYVGRCLKRFYIFNQLVVCFLIILIMKIIW